MESFHIHDEVSDGVDIELTLPSNPDIFMQFGLVMYDHKSVILQSKTSELVAGLVLRKKFDTIILY